VSGHPIPPAGRRLGIDIPALILLLVFAESALIVLRAATDPDYGWHVANGRNLWNGILLGGHDVYSWTARGHLWVAHEWLTDAAMAFLNDTFGPVAASLVSAAVVLGALGLVARRLRDYGFGLIAIAASVAVICLGAYVSIGVRPQMLELLYLSAWLLTLDEWLAGRLRTARLFALGAVLTLLWANSHASFPLAAAGALAVAAALVVRGDRRAVPALVLTAMVGAVPLANPWGVQLYGFATQSLSSSVTQHLIQEWQPPRLLTVEFAPFTAELALLGVGVLLAAKRWIQRTRSPATLPSVLAKGIAAPLRAVQRLASEPSVGYVSSAALTAPLVVLAVHSARFAMLVGICAAPLIAWTLQCLGVRGSDRLRRVWTRRWGGTGHQPAERARVNLAIGILGSLVLCVAGLARVTPAAQQAAITSQYPVALLPALDRAVASAGGPSRARLLNDYAWGGFLLEQRPGLPVFIDGRSEVYGDRLLQEAATLYDVAPGWQAELRQFHLRIALLGSTSALARALEQAGWTAVGEDSLAVVLVAPGTS
jgi:hypothetical protein